MNVGIISFWDTQHNYGQLLQCYAMQHIVRLLGHSPQHIRYNLREKTIHEKVISIYEILKSGHLYSYCRLIKEAKKNAKMWEIADNNINNEDRHFDEFRNKYLSLTNKLYSSSELLNNPPIFDAYICGSDQIWSAPSKLLMLQFGPKKAKRLAIAASMGGIHIDNAYHKYLYKKFLKKFDFVSLREEKGTQEIIALGRRDAETILDPTLNLDKSVFKNISHTPKKRDYVFVYLLGNKMDLSVDKIYEWAKIKELEVVYVGAQGRIDSYKKIYPSVNEWLGYIDNAKYIITNSFHGMALSIVFEKQFLAIPLSAEFARMNDRVIEVLDRFNLNSRLYTDTLDDITIPINYDKITQKRLNMRKDLLNRISNILTLKQD